MSTTSIADFPLGKSANTEELQMFKMLGIKLLPQDIKEKAKLERMRILEEERRKRIFKPKERMIGIDKTGIQRQIEEKRREKELNDAIDNKHYRTLLSSVKAAEKLEQEAVQAKKRLNLELKLFRDTFQQKEDRREYDISNPSKVIEYEKELGISSGQTFEGEDIRKKEREAIQVEQQKNWLLQQMCESNQTKKEEEMAEKIFMDCLKSREQKAMYLDKLEKDCRHQIRLATEAYNSALARENALNRKAKKERELQDNLMDIINTINSDLLTENPDVSQSNLGLNKVIQYHYKGMPEAERQEIRKLQLRQIELHKAKLEEEAAYEMKWNKFYKSVDDLLTSRQQILRQQEREYMKRIMEENKIINSDQKFQRSCERKKAESDYTTPEFFSKFNQSSR